MSIVTTIPLVPIHRGSAAYGDHPIVGASGEIAGLDAVVEVTARGIYIRVGGQSYAVDLHQLVRSMGEAIEAHLDQAGR